jgi:hypothetical protein
MATVMAKPTEIQTTKSDYLAAYRSVKMTRDAQTVPVGSESVGARTADSGSERRFCVEE